MAAEVVYGFYLDSYGGWALAEEFAGALPAALRCVRGLVGGVDVDALDSDELDAWSRAICAAVDVIAELGEGQVGGFEVGDYQVSRHVGDDVESGTAQAARAALAELAGTGLAFCGAT